MMPNYICCTCGTQFAPSDRVPDGCPVCLDDRQYVGWSGQRWTTLEALRRSHRNTVKQEEPNLLSIGMEPSFGIGQRAFLVLNPKGNVLWDCLPLFDDGLVKLLNAVDGISAIAISHPHYYATMVEWSRAFDAPVYLHSADRQWVMRPEGCLEFWEGESRLFAGDCTLIRCGGHFDGGTVFHWPDGAGGKGVLLSGDILQVVQDRRWVSFMYSYPNLIPLSASDVRRIVDAVTPFAFDRIYGAFWGRVVKEDARTVVEKSASRYLQAISHR